MTQKNTKEPYPWLLLGVTLLGVGSFFGLIVGTSISFQQNNRQATQIATQATQTVTQWNDEQATALTGATQEARATAAIATTTARAATSTATSAAALLAVTKNLNASDPGPPYSPYLVGKLLVINQATHQIDTTILSDDNFSEPTESDHGDYILPANLLATTPDQVGTIILLDCRRVQVGSFDGGPYRPYGVIPAYQRSCTMTIIDRGKALVVGKKDFTGPPPRFLISCTSTSCPDAVFGSYPATDMVNYLESLPRR